jgi:HJR/Mrr/RecB family endonuclease
MSYGCLMVALMANEGTWPGNRGRQQDEQQVAEADAVPLLPAWIKGRGSLALLVAGVPALVVLVMLTANHEGGDAMALTLAVATAIVTLLVYSYVRRGKAHQRWRRQELRAALEIARVGEMSWQQFEIHCKPLFEALDYTHVRKTRNVPGLKAVDFTAIDPQGKLVVIECKHWNHSVGVKEVRDLIGKTAYGVYKGCAAILVTSSEVTRGAREAADEVGITIVDRGLLARWLAEAVERLETAEQGRGRPAASGFAGYLRTRSGEAKATAVILTGAFLVVFIVVVQIATQAGPAAAGFAPVPATSKAPRPDSRPTAALTASTPKAPASVVKAFLAAISKHDWPEVWKLGGKYIGQGPYTSYSGMISGYEGTIRDVPVMLKTVGQTVSGQFLAYESDGEVRTYAATYVVRSGVIIHADQHEVRSTSLFSRSGIGKGRSSVIPAGDEEPLSSLEGCPAAC